MAKSAVRSAADRAATTMKRLRSAAKKRVVTPEELERWERLLDPSRCSIREFIENYRVATKEVQEDGTVQTGIELWPAQLRILDAIETAWAEGKAAKLVIVKDREQGCSFIIQAIFWERFLRGGGGEMRTVSHKDEATLALQTDFHSFRLQTPDFVFDAILGTEWVSEAEGKWKMLWPGKHFSIARTMTCRDGAMGRGDRIRWAHYSEYPWWPTGKGNVGGALATLRDTPGNIYIFESTGKDFDEFYNLANNAREGRNGWTCLFLSWLTHPGKRSFFTHPAERESFSESVGKLDRYGREEELAILEETGGDLERLKWRREQIDGPVCNGDVAFFAREHPRLFNQAFYTDSDSVFDPEVLDSRMDASRDEESRAIIGDVEVRVEKGKARCEFVPRRTGNLRIYKMPEKGRRYCYGADPSQGKKVADGGRRTGDYSTMLVLDVDTLDVCALYRGHTPPEEFAGVIYGISMFYGWAPGYVETNADGRTVLHVCGRLDSEWDTPDTPILPQIRKIPTKGGETFEHHLGFLSDPVTKPVAVNRLKKWVRKMGVWKPGEPARIPLPLLTEMRLYIAVQTYNKRGMPTGNVRLEAQRGHDDTVSAAWMAFEAAEWLAEHPHDATTSDGAPLPYDPVERTMMIEVEREMGTYRPETCKLWLPRGAKHQAPGGDDDYDMMLGSGF